ncbi:MAG: WbqC family protein [Chitinophagales bacterium]|nr:WbqC family protein [Chitinophagales bacterium]
MKVAIMQPYILPYIGYFQLINSVDVFVIYDNIKYTKKGWINRNRLLLNGKDEYFSVPLKNDSDQLDIVQRALAPSFVDEGAKTLRKIALSYKKAPFFAEVFPLAEQIFSAKETNLFTFLHQSLLLTTDYLGVDTKIVVSSTLNIDHSLKSQDKVIALCKATSATTYVNPIGGVSLYSKEAFSEQHIQLHFLQSKPFEYAQSVPGFTPWLSILDVMMHNDKDTIKNYLDHSYDLI